MLAEFVGFDKALVEVSSSFNFIDGSFCAKKESYNKWKGGEWVLRAFEVLVFLSRGPLEIDHRLLDQI